jgi:hypothetical protein
MDILAEINRVMDLEGRALAKLRAAQRLLFGFMPAHPRRLAPLWFGVIVSIMATNQTIAGGDDAAR